MSCTTLAALANVTKYLLTLIAPLGVCINRIPPGGISTKRFKRLINNYSKRLLLSRDGKFEESHPMLEITLNKQHGYITGEKINSDEGFSLW